ncbi:SDR family NAD(P)-dependent oxidoreductase [Mucilaginibacter aquaedulcis]|uniref:SDR family NAD(P)-dependent oxidoreductase n=1 Tax=Mucilaginibacter aquaedulcis TaxID=1187081 RepID=UPI0025B58A1C|nr:SDR family NAD(P)-dependent oxidoreductase [Mucilaginibacter aquaedulcis]MDN3546966.1 SDR family NAD(P)-dependent oxidoreductase [Mucilaginibacter aquaedulcis]
MKTSSFDSKSAIVIGGTSGMGKATAKSLLQQGAKVTVVSKSQASVDAAVAELSAYGNVTGVRLDLNSDADVKNFISSLEADDKPVDYLVNSSGIFAPKTFLDSTPEDYDSFQGINRGFYFITQAVAKKMKANGGGAIVNVGSYWANNAVKGTPTSAYSMAKAALHAFTKHAAMELSDDKIRVNAIAPGIVETGVLDELIGSAQGVIDAYHGLNSIHPLGRNGQPQEIADAILFLLSDNASWITGAILDIDGGMAAGRS